MKLLARDDDTFAGGGGGAGDGEPHRELFVIYRAKYGALLRRDVRNATKV